MKLRSIFSISHLLSAACWLLFILSLLSVYIGFAEQILPVGGFYTSDALYMPDLYRDLFSEYSLWGRTFIPGRPYFFPDMLLFFALNFMTGNFHIATLLHGLVQCLLFVTGLIVLGMKLFPQQRRQVRTSILLVSALFFFLFSTGRMWAFFPMFIAGHHFSVTLALLYSLLLGIGLLQSRGEALKVTCYALALLLLSSAMLVSDSVFLIQCLLPLSCGFFLCYLFSLCSARQLLIALFSLTPALLITAKLTPHLLIFWPPSIREPAKIHIEKILYHSQGTLKQILSWGEDSLLFGRLVFPAFAILWALFTIVACTQMIQLLAARRHIRFFGKNHIFFTGAISLCFMLHLLTGVLLAPPHTQIPWIAWGTMVLTIVLLLLSKYTHAELSEEAHPGEQNVLFFFFTLLSSLAVNLASSLLTGTAVPRYFLPSLLIPIAFGWPFVLAKSPRFNRLYAKRFAPGALILLVLTAAWQLGALQTLGKTASLSRLKAYSTPFSRCLDEQAEKFGLQHGLAEYWLAKPAALLSEKNLNIVPVQLIGPHVRINHWQSNLNRYAHDFDFIISWLWPGNPIRSIPFWVIKGIFGEPLADVACGDKHILIYTRDTDFRFRKQFAKHFRRHLHASEQVSQTGEIIDGTSRIAREGEHQPGFIVFGPYTQLFIGDHEFTYYIEARQSADHPSVGHMELLFRENGSKTVIPLERREIKKEGVQELSGHFTLRNAGRVELRIYYNGTGELRVDSLDIQRIR